ncbi:MAG TPA: hypothetical protein VFJ81_11265 [Gemmatimonadales bacterium]|nr:hypothetical protein [Gemmatimonadales bacterium]
MRNVFALLAVCGLAGVVFGVLDLLRSAPGQSGPVPFSHEGYGGPGAIMGGLLLLATSLYLRAAWQGRN